MDKNKVKDICLYIGGATFFFLAIYNSVNTFQNISYLSLFKMIQKCINISVMFVSGIGCFTRRKKLVIMGVVVIGIISVLWQTATALITVDWDFQEAILGLGRTSYLMWQAASIIGYVMYGVGLMNRKYDPILWIVSIIILTIITVDDLIHSYYALWGSLYSVTVSDILLCVFSPGNIAMSAAAYGFSRREKNTDETEQITQVNGSETTTSEQDEVSEQNVSGSDQIEQDANVNE